MGADISLKHFVGGNNALKALAISGTRVPELRFCMKFMTYLRGNLA